MGWVPDHHNTESPKRALVIFLLIEGTSCGRSKAKCRGNKVCVYSVNGYYLNYFTCFFLHHPRGLHSLLIRLGCTYLSTNYPQLALALLSPQTTGTDRRDEVTALVEHKVPVGMENKPTHIDNQHEFRLW